MSLYSPITSSWQNTTTFSAFSYTFNAANLITSYTGPEGTLDYEYDPLGQLIEVTGARTESYSFDSNGNRTMSGYETGSENRLLSDGVYDYTYDMEGSPLTKTRISDGEVTEYTWDHRKRLTDVVVKDEEDTILKVVHYTYDVHDRRIGKWVDADGEGAGEHTELWTAYDGDNPYADFDAAGSLTTRYLYGPAIDQLFARIHSGEDIDWYLTDHLGSVRQIVDSQDNVIDELAYDSFGQVLSETAPSVGDRFKYTSREWDEETGQYYYRARYYGADIGRFITQDPLGFAAGDANTYRYVFNLATNFTDPTGKILFAAPWLAWVYGVPTVVWIAGGVATVAGIGYWYESQTHGVSRVCARVGTGFYNIGGGIGAFFTTIWTGIISLMDGAAEADPHDVRGLDVRWTPIFGQNIRGYLLTE